MACESVIFSIARKTWEGTVILLICISQYAQELARASQREDLYIFSNEQLLTPAVPR